jgi:hypothetical protein
MDTPRTRTPARCPGGAWQSFAFRFRAPVRAHGDALDERKPEKPLIPFEKFVRAIAGVPRDEALKIEEAANASPRSDPAQDVRPHSSPR